MVPLCPGEMGRFDGSCNSSSLEVRAIQDPRIDRFLPEPSPPPDPDFPLPPVHGEFPA